MRTIARLIALGLLLAAASGLYWVDTLRRGTPERPTAASGEREPEAYFTGFTLREHDQVGEAGYTLRGRRLTRFDDGTSGIAQPDLEYRAVDGPPWLVTARSGRIAADGDRIDLVHDVVIDRAPGASSPVTLRTQRLVVFAEAGRAETDQRVDAEGPGWRTRGTGMTAWLEQDRVELHAEVASRYDPTRAR